MYFAVRHHTHYRYDVPVSLGAHTVRLTPQGPGVRLHAHALQVSPQPTMHQGTRDAYGNEVTVLTFDGSTQELRIDSQFELETSTPPVPYNNLPPLPWPTQHADGLQAYRDPAIDPQVQAFAAELAGAVSQAPLPFLDRLASELYGFDRHIRQTGAAHPPQQTLATRRGACRDLSQLFIAACRSVGMASRFVSGYQAHAETVDGQRYLHAWAEVALPEVGFVGWDPTHGVRVQQGHVALCAAPDQAATMPVEGGFTFQGPEVNSTLDFSLTITTR